MNLNAGELAGAPGLGLGLAGIAGMYQAAENVKVYKQRCKNASRRCGGLLVALQDSTEGLEGEQASMIADEIAGIIKRAKNKVAEWSSYNSLRSLLVQKDIRGGLEEIDREIDEAMMKFHFKMTMELARYNIGGRIAQKNDQMELRDLLARVVKDVEDIKALVVMESPARPVVEEVMASLQTELMAPDLQPSHGEVFKKGLWMLHERTRKLPPMTDLTGQIERTSKHPVARGTYNDVYTGIWLGKEQVALRLPRLMPGIRDVHKRFEKDLTIWRKLDHPYVVPLYGITYEGPEIYSVSPWMDNNTADQYVLKYPDVDRLQIMYQASAGLEYLHDNGIIHGDLRAGNILINKDGIARLSDFGMSKVLEDCGHGMTTAPGINPRWHAPELLHPNASSSKETDIWSFAMACLELLTGQPPYATIKNDIAVLQQIQHSKYPQRPNSPHVTDPVWSLLKKCWEKKPKSRPTISSVRKEIASIRGAFKASQAAPTRLDLTSILSFRRSSKKQRAVVSSPDEDVQLPPLNLQLVSEPANFSSASPKDHSRGWAWEPSNTGISPPLIEVVEVGEVSWEEVTEVGGRMKQVDLLGTGPGEYPSCSSPSSSRTTQSLPQDPLSAQQKSSFTSDSSSQYSASARAAVTDTTPIVNLQPDSAVASGTLEGLVERLINSFNLRQDMEFRDVLLSSTVDFVSSEEFFSVIERRFHAAEHLAVSNPEDRVGIQYNVLLIISYWISNPRLPLDSQLTWQMRNFCDSAKNRVNSPMMRDKADKIIQSLNQDIRSNSLPPRPEGPPMQAPDMLPNDLAIGLTLLESDKFKQIHPSDYFLHLGGHPGPNGVEAACQVNNKIVVWVQKSVLHFTDVVRRKEVMTFFLHTAKECLRLRNFASATAISAALNSSAIESLDYTREQLDQPLKQILNELNQLTSPSKAHHNYRASLSLVNHTKGVPWLAVHLKDLHLVLQKHPTTTERDGHTLINFERYTQFHACLRESLATFSNDTPAYLEEYRHRGQLAFVESKLSDIELGEDVDIELQERAEQFKVAERTARRYRVVERDLLGLRKPKRKKGNTL